MAETVPTLRLTDQQRRNLGGHIAERLDELEYQHRRLFNDIAVWWKWYEARPHTERKRTPWDGASNAVLPVIQTMADNLVAREFAITFSHGKVWTGRTMNESFRPHVQPVTDFLNWASRNNEFSLLLPLLDFYTEKAVVGESLLSVDWHRKERWVLAPGGGKQRRRVFLNRGPIVEHIPRHLALWAPGRSIDESDMVAVQQLMPPGELVRSAQFDGFDEEAVGRALKHPGNANSSGYRIEQEREAEASRELETLSRTRDPHDVRKIWLDTSEVFGMDSSLGKELERRKSVVVVVHYHPASREVLRVVPDPYGLGHKPFYLGYLRKRSGQRAGRGAAKMLEHLQRSMSTMFNQAIDAVTLSNSMPGKTTDPNVAKRQFTPWQMIHLSDMNAFEILNKPKQVFPEQSMVNLAQVFAERLMGVTDPLLGRESRSGGHPSPATNFLGLMEQGRELQSPTMMINRSVLGEMGQDLATLYQLFDTDPDGRIVRLMGLQDGQKVLEWLFPRDTTIIGNLELDIFAVDEQRNPQARQQQAIALTQVTNNYYTTVLPLLQMMLNPRVPRPLRTEIQQAVTANTNAFKRFLEASDVDEVEEFILASQQANDTQLSGLTGILQRLAERAGGGASTLGGAGAVQGPGLEGPTAPPGLVPRATGIANGL